MPMITCKECGGTVSDRLSKCPHCGAPLEKKSDRYSQFYEKQKPTQLYQPEPQYIEEREDRPRRQTSSKGTALGISAILISLMAFITSFVAIVIASSKPKEVYVEKETSVHQEAETERAENDNVELVIPSDFVEVATQEELDNIVKEKDFISATLNPDGSATYVIAKSQHKELMKEITEEINSSLNEMINSEECPNITDIKTNSDFTNFSITTASTELSLEETLSVMIFYTYGGMYNVFNGTPVDNVHIDFINADSGDIIDSFNSADMGNMEESSQEAETSESKEYGLEETWTVDGQWSMTVNSVSVTDDRNEFSEKDPAQVLIINYEYENIGYEDDDGIMDGLYIDLESEQIVDSKGFMGYSYPCDITNYPTEAPVGAKCKAQSCIGLDSESTEVKIVINKYDGTGTEQTAAFILPIE